MKAIRQNDREVRVEDDNITENTNATSKEKFTISCCLHTKPKDAKKPRETYCFKVQ